MTMIRQPGERLEADIPLTVAAAPEIEHSLDQVGAEIVQWHAMLSEAYRYRTDEMTFRWKGNIESFTTFATRDAAGDAIEEIYTLHDRYSIGLKPYHVRTLAVDIFTDGHTRIVVGPDGTVETFTFDGDTPRQVTDSTQAASVTDEFFYRSLIAIERVNRRSATERQLADQDALSKLHYRMYGGPKVTTSEE